MARNQRPRPYGTGTVYIEGDAWMGRWVTDDGKRPNRKLGSIEDLNKKQAEEKLRELRAGDEDAPVVARSKGRDIPLCGKLRLDELEIEGKKKSHRETFASHLRVHINDWWAGIPVASADRDRVNQFVLDLRRRKDARTGRPLSPKTINNILGTLHSCFAVAEDRGWCKGNPVKKATKPDLPDYQGIERYLTVEDLLAVVQAARDYQHRAFTWEQVQTIRATGPGISNVALAAEYGVSDALISGIRRGTKYRSPEPDWSLVDVPLILAAAMTGLRQGELLGLPWHEIKWSIERIHVRRAYVRGEYGKPKSKRSVREVPAALAVLAELEQLFQASAFTGDEDLVFGHPITGEPMHRSNVTKRFKAYCRAAGVREVRFHDLRHTFGTTVASKGEAGMRALQEWFGHADGKTTERYAAYQPGADDAALVSRAFAPRGESRLTDRSSDRFGPR